MISNSWKYLKDTFVIESDALVQMGNFLDKNAFNKAVKVLQKAPRIGASGCGHTGIACMHFTHLMCCIERPARFISPAEAIHGALGFLQKGDAMLLASRGGGTAELFPIIDICRHKSVTLIGLTENFHSPLALKTDIFLPMKLTREADKYNAQGTTSFTVMCVIFDAIQAALIEETGYKSEQFAVIHPGGAVGKRLNKKEKLK